MDKKIVTLSVVSLLAGTLWAKSVHSVEFQNISVPKTDAQKRLVRATHKMSVDGKSYEIGYHTILRSGQVVGDNIFGLVYDHNGKPIAEKDGSLMISDSNDFTSLLPVNGKLYMVSHFESRPAAVYVSELKQDKDGNLKAISTKNVDFSKDHGLWVPCAGCRTPWMTHLGSEEYEPNAAKVKPNGSINPYYDAMAAYYGGDLKKINPYYYGWITEISVNGNGEAKAVKHYSMGRFSHELAYVMPDERTVFFGDDGTNTALFMFIADNKADLTSGNLYAAKWMQTSAKNGGSAKLKWISLGHADDASIKKVVDKGLRFNDIFESITPDGATPPKGFTSIHASGGHEWLKIKKGMDEIASRLEARRYAAIKGATTEFRKMEGITFNPNRNEIYVSISSVGKSMEDNMKKGKPTTKYDIGGPNDIRLPYNPCGAVFKMSDLREEFGSKYVPHEMSSLVAGSTKGKTDKFNKCSIDGLANPDNISYLQNSNQLIIGEDTGSGHQNDYIWSYNLDNGKLTRIETTPYGSETTSVYHYNDIYGHGYIMSVVQHPFGEGDAVTSEENMPKMAKNPNDKHAYTGYIGPLPVLK